jgi:arsenate reductase
MEREVVLYHNPRCSKSRQALELLREADVTPRIVEYLKEPPAAADVEKLIELLGIEPHALLRTKEEPYERLGLTPKSSAKEIARAIAKEPILLERPIVVVGKKAVIGRPPERVLDLVR